MKKINLFLTSLVCGSTLNLINPTLSVKKDNLQFWPPAIVKKDVVRNASHFFHGKNKDYWKGELTISLEEDLKFLHKLGSSVDIEEIDISLNLATVNKGLNKKLTSFEKPVIWKIEGHELKQLTSLLIDGKSLTFKFETKGLLTKWDIRLWNDNFTGSDIIGFHTSANFKNIIGTNGLIFDYTMGDFDANIKYNYLINDQIDEKLNELEEKFKNFLNDNIGQQWNLDLSTITRFGNAVKIIEKWINEELRAYTSGIINIELFNKEQKSMFLSKGDNNIKIKAFFLDKDFGTYNVKLQNIREAQNQEEFRKIIKKLDENDWSIDMTSIQNGKYQDLPWEKIHTWIDRQIKISVIERTLFEEWIDSAKLINGYDHYNFISEIRERLNKEIFFTTKMNQEHGCFYTNLYTKNWTSIGKITFYYY